MQLAEMQDAIGADMEACITVESFSDSSVTPQKMKQACIFVHVLVDVVL